MARLSGVCVTCSIHVCSHACVLNGSFPDVMCLLHIFDYCVIEGIKHALIF